MRSVTAMCYGRTLSDNIIFRIAAMQVRERPFPSSDCPRMRDAARGKIFAIVPFRLPATLYLMTSTPGPKPEGDNETRPQPIVTAVLEATDLSAASASFKAISPSLMEGDGATLFSMLSMKAAISAA